MTMEFASIKQKQIAAAESKHNLDSNYIEGQLEQLETVLNRLQDFSDSELVDADDAIECIQSNISALEEMLDTAHDEAQCDFCDKPKPPVSRGKKHFANCPTAETEDDPMDASDDV